VDSRKPRYRRVLLKLSGEALLGDADFGIDPRQLRVAAAGVKDLLEAGVEVALVIGAGNVFRGADLVAGGMERVTADQIGMLGTIMNALALQDALEAQGMMARVMSAVRINQMCEEYIRRRAVRHLEKGRVVVFAAGTGNPFFTTDSAASLRAIEIDADLLIKATKVDGVFSADPERDPHATRYRQLGYDEVLDRKLAVMDATAIVLCREHRMPIRVLNMRDPRVLVQAVMGAEVGTLVGPPAGG
jgi:uridylate kinase